MRASYRYLCMPLTVLLAGFSILRFTSHKRMINVSNRAFVPISTNEGKSLIKFRIGEKGSSDVRILSYSDVVDLWQSDQHFVNFFTQVLREVPFRAYFWETPPVRNLEEQEFEFIVQESSRLATVHGNPSAFAEHIKGNKGTNCVQTFSNLGNNALLVVPCENGDVDNYAHIGNFLRSAPHEQILEFWRTVGENVRREANDMKGKPLWVSTSGLGVYWLHVRLDLYPKYYTYRPYKEG